jgi:3-phosphoshikimate 1-carboxyvinyltransferase
VIPYPDRTITGWQPQIALRWAAAVAHLPSDKSISHRALLFAGLADHPVALRGINSGAAVRLLVEAMIGIGLEIEVDRVSDRITVVRGFFLRTPQPCGTVSLGPSSAAARLLIGVLVGAGIECVVDGDDTLRNRPFDWIVDPIRELGGQLSYVGAHGRLPIRIERGEFRGGTTRTRVGSAQSVSAVLFAGIAARRSVEIDYPVPGRDHTQRMAASFGEQIEDLPRRDGTGGRIHFAPKALRVPHEIMIPRDPSALAYIAALFWLRNLERSDAEARFEGVCLNPTRLGFFRWMERCGFRLAIEPTTEVCGEPVGTVILRGGGAPRATGLASKVELHAMIDEVPLAVAITCLIPGQAAFRDLYELTFKETDRIDATQRMLKDFGLTVAVDNYDIHVTGGQALAPAPQGGGISSFGDHRLSMTAHVLLHACGRDAVISEGECFRTSFPAFGICLDAIAAEVCDVG